ncbi:PKD domain-containing protein [Cellulomonas sp. DKR-3]|uniref:PKD domain-containing protein n=1 Tax=Cellulomonas fulva TaxID=2835530 RepID=A0ABS5TUR3_9CELL|nr:PKD domain-containing protein [Cellulomonas fulva]MBT0992894.1 PKD domain-containing protein [Cellulomonas fulva]
MALVVAGATTSVAADPDPGDYPFIDPAAYTGASADTAAASCWEIKQLHPDSTSGVYWVLTPEMTAPTQVWCDQETDGGGWVKVGQGRQTWEPNTAARGTLSSLLSGTPAANASAQLSTAQVDGLLGGKAVSELTDGVRLRRATDQAGTSWQEVRVSLPRLDGWAWTFGAGHVLGSWRIGATTGSGGSSAQYGSGSGLNVVDSNISPDQSYTWGFAYGSGVSGSSSTSSYLWSKADGQGNARPFTEVYVRPKLLNPVLDFTQIPDAGTAPMLRPAGTSSLVQTNPWGVSGLKGAVSGEGDVEVQAITQIGARMYVGGNFRYVQRDSAGTGRVEQSFLAAFDASTGQYVTGFTPTFNEAVESLAALPDGRLAVGGRFTQVNGQAVTGLTVLDAATGAVSGSFRTTITNNSSPGSVQVQALAVGGGYLYLGGNFTHLQGASGAATYSRNGARVSASTGQPDTSWRPELTGSVRAIDIKDDSSRAYLAGFFESVGTVPAENAVALLTSSGASVDPTPWAPVWSAAKSYQQAIDQAGSRVWVGGSEHSMFGFDTTTYARRNTTIANPKGDFQAISSGNGWVYAGAHANNFLYTGAQFWPNVGSSWTKVDNIGWVAAWNTETGAVDENFSPTISSRLGSGVWAIKVASDGTMWAGGDLVSGRGVASGNTWLGGFARFAPADTTAPAVPTNLRIASQDATSVRLQWNASVGGLGTGGAYQVLRNDRVIATTTSTAITVPKGGANRYFVRAADGADNASASTPVLVVPGGNAAPVAVISSSVSGLAVTFSSSASTDDQGVAATYWDLGDGTTSTSSSLTHTYDGGGTYRIALVVVDAQGSWTRTTKTLALEQPAPADAYGKAVFDDSPQLYWRLGESAGTKAKDAATGQNVGAYQQGVSLGSAGALVGVADTAAGFDGSNDVVVASKPVANPTVFSVEAWFQTTTNRGGKIIGFGNNPSGTSTQYDRHVYMQDDGRLVFGTYTGVTNTITSAGAYNDGQWHQVVAGIGPSGMVLYVDGVLAGTNPNTGSEGYSGYWRVGGDTTWGSSSAYFAGRIDEAAVYGGVLSQAQVREHFTLGSGLSDPPAPVSDAYGTQVLTDDPDLFWRLDETAPGLLADATGNFDLGRTAGGVTMGTAAGFVGSARTATFNGSDGTAATVTGRSGTSLFSLELWFKTTTNRGGKLVGFSSAKTGGSGSYDRHVYMLDGGQLVFGTYTGVTNTITTPASYNDGKWHQVVATLGPAGMALYVDGALRASGSQTQAQAFSGYWRLGGDTTWGGTTSNYFAGQLDEFSVYPVQLTAARVATHYGAGATINAAPVASFTAVPSPLKVAVDAGDSHDPDGTIVSFAWDFGDGTTGTGATAQHDYDAPGDYVVRLTVTDDLGGVATTSRTVSVPAPPNRAPTAVADTTVDDLEVQVDGSGSSDPDGDALTYAWDFDGQGTATGREATFEFTTAGTYDVTLTVDDGRGGSDSTTVPVTVEAPQDPVTTVAIAQDAAWRWRFATGAPPSAWNQVGFDASAWPVGGARLGFGATQVVTNIDTFATTADRARAAYFVRSVQVPDASRVVSLRLDSVADDGVVIYVNGTEVARHNMRPDETVTYLTYAASARRITVAENDPVVVDVPVGLLRDGTNVISAETHLNYRATPDVSFWLKATLVTQ